MNDLNQMTTPVLQDWWERYVCPVCLSKHRDSVGGCSHPWHRVPAITFECEGSSFSPLSIPVTELQQAGLIEAASVRRYGHLWFRVTHPRRRPKPLGAV